MAFTNQYSLALDSVFQQRILVAMDTAATNVQAEATSTPNHTNRADYATKVLNAPRLYLEPFCFAVVTNVAITAASLDSDIQFAVNSLWSAMSGTI